MDLLKALNEHFTAEFELAHSQDMPPEKTVNYERANNLRLAVQKIKELRAALEPFTKIGVGVDEPVADTDDWFRHDGDVLTVGDFRRARRVCG